MANINNPSDRTYFSYNQIDMQSNGKNIVLNIPTVGAVGLSVYDGVNSSSYTAGYAISPQFIQQSSVEKKENIHKLDSNSKDLKIKTSAVDIIKEADICEYNFENSKRTSVGLVLGEGYNAPKEVAVGNIGVDLYSMSSLSWKAIQELTEQNKALQQRLHELEKRL